MRFYYIISLFLIPLAAFSQAHYWQQEVHYEIKVSLDDHRHELHARMEMEYINHSPDALDRIYIHLWPNAYSSQNTEFAREQIHKGNLRFYDAPLSDYGFIDSLAFTVNGEYVKWEYTENPDIAVLFMPKPLAPGTSTRIATPFRVRIPASFSRLGHNGQAYQITQWYPKPAVYDKNGWHPMPYRDQGEFYSEYGRFDVEITLPSNYVVGATGTLQNVEELRWLARKAIESRKELDARSAEIQASFDPDSFPASSPSKKTLRFLAEDVHDFAWFADKRFYVLQDQVNLPGGRIIQSNALFTGLEAGLWTNSLDYINSALLHYSELVGEYRYPQCTAVEGALSAGAGMEYPMITIIGKSRTAEALQQVILHEVGHNWFYGMLGSNERDAPWMDEGINSNYENRFYRGKEQSLSAIPVNQSIFTFLGLKNMDQRKLIQLALTDQWITGRDQAATLPADAYTPTNYGLDVYAKSALLLEHLEGSLGASTFDGVMKDYFNKWLFKHPQPEDFKDAFDQSVDEDLSWFFQDLMKEDRAVDGKIKLKRENGSRFVELSARKRDRAPLPLAAYRNEMKIWEQWLQPGEALSLDEVPEADKIVVDPDWQTFDIDRRNNFLYPNRFLKKSIIPRPHFLGGIESPEKRNFYFLPAIGWNSYDQVYAGLALYNNLFPRRPFHFRVMPAYAFGSKRPVGTAYAEYTFNFHQKYLRNIKLTAEGRQFSQNNLNGLIAEYQKFAPSVEVEFQRIAEDAHWKHLLKFRTIAILSDQYQSGQNELYLEEEKYIIHELQYRWSNNFVLFPWDGLLTLEDGGSYSKASIELNFRFRSRGLGSYIRLRTFASYFAARGPYNRLQFLAAPTVGQRPGYLDYKYDHFFLGRNNYSGLWSRQLMPGDGNFRVNMAAFPFGKSNSWLVATNLLIPVPRLPVYLYGDLAIIPSTGLPTVLAESGVQLSIASEAFSIYFPLVMSGDVKQAFVSTGDHYFQRVTFTLNLQKLNVIKMVRNLRY